MHCAMYGFGNADAARPREGLHARRDIDAVALTRGFADQHLAEIDPDPEYDRVVLRIPHCVIAELTLDRDGKLQRLRGALEQGQDAVTGRPYELTAVVAMSDRIRRSDCVTRW